MMTSLCQGVKKDVSWLKNRKKNNKLIILDSILKYIILSLTVFS